MIVTLAGTLRAFVLGATEKLGFLVPTLTRFCVGWVFLTSGWGKLHNLQSVTAYFAELGIPYPELQAPFASAVELVAGAALLLGLFTRLASIPLVVVMIVAIATAKRTELTSFTDLFGIVEYLYVLLLGQLIVLGAGPLSLDRLLVNRFRDEIEEPGAPSLGGRELRAAA